MRKVLIFVFIYVDISTKKDSLKKVFIYKKKGTLKTHFYKKYPCSQQCRYFLTTKNLSTKNNTQTYSSISFVSNNIKCNLDFRTLIHIHIQSLTQQEYKWWLVHTYRKILYRPATKAETQCANWHCNWHVQQTWFLLLLFFIDSLLLSCFKKTKKKNFTMNFNFC